MNLISIIMPVFNKAQHIEKSIRSVQSQSYQNIELLIIDDGSTDNSSDIINRIAQHDQRIKYFYQKNMGVSAARNSGVEIANGHYISFLDADDEYESTFISEMMDAIKGDDAAYCAHYTSRAGRHKKSRFSFFEENLLLAYLLNRCTPNTNSWLIQRNFIIKNNIKFKPGVNWGEDMMFFSEIILKSNKINPCKKFLTKYNMDIEQSLSLNEKSTQKLEKDIYWMKHVRSQIKNSTLKKEYKNQCIDAIDKYRLPAGLIYRIKSNRKLTNNPEFINLYNKYNLHFRKSGFNNGVRSIKLISSLIVLRFYYFTAKLRFALTQN
ncbi:putative glycosyltransferase EpsJ [compost metagenome]